MATYYKPADNLIVDGKLVIPSTRQSPCKNYFSYRSDNIYRVDIYRDIKKNTVPWLKDLAHIIGISDYDKMKKATLVEEISNRIVFE